MKRKGNVKGNEKGIQNWKIKEAMNTISF